MMKAIVIERSGKDRLLKWYFILLFMLVLKIPGAAQDFSVYTLQNMSFGAFFQGTGGGTIEVTADGSRTVSGDVVPIYLGIPYYQAIFEIEAPVGTIISILNSAEVQLPGSNGGMLKWTVGTSSPASPFVITVPAPGRTQVSVGGKLSTGGTSSNPPGSYSGTIFFTFNNE